MEYQRNLVYLMKTSRPAHSVLHMKNGRTSRDFLLAGTDDGIVSFWDLSTRRIFPAYKLQTGTTACVVILDVHPWLVTQDRLGLVRVWFDHQSGWSQGRELQLDYCGLCRVSGSQDMGGVIVCPRSDGIVDIHQVTSGSRILSLAPDKSEADKLGAVMVMKLIHCGGNPYLLSVYENGTMTIWDLRNLSIISRESFKGTPVSVDYDDDKCCGVCMSAPNKLQVFAVDGALHLSVAQKMRLDNKGAGCVRIHAKANVCVIGGWDGKIRLFSFDPFLPLAVIGNHTKSVEDICFINGLHNGFCEDSNCSLAIASLDCRISLWQLH